MRTMRTTVAAEPVFVAHAVRGVSGCTARKTRAAPRCAAPRVRAEVLSNAENVAPERPSRRAVFVRGAAAAALALRWSSGRALADEEPTSLPLEPAEATPLVTGENWQLVLPAGFEREALSPVLEAPSTTVGAAPRPLPGFGPAPLENPLKLRAFGTGRAEVVSLAVRRAADLRPTFLQVNDITDFGTLSDVASLLVPPKARLLVSSSASSVTPSPLADDVALQRTYYTYEFERGPLHGILVAAVKYGKTYVLLAFSTSPQFDDAAAARLRAVAASFRVVG